MGKGVQQRGNRHRFGEAVAGERPEALPAEEMDSGADLFMVGPEQEDEQGLRKAAGERRGFHLRGDEPPHGEAFGSLMRLFRQFPNGVLRSSHAGSCSAQAR
jgi:hypothetical protein